MTVALLGDSKDSTSGDAANLSSKKSSSTRMVTRLRNPDSKLSQLKNQQVAAAVHEANRGFKEGKEVRVGKNFFLLQMYEEKKTASCDVD